MTNASDNKHKAKVNAIARLLELIEGVNQELAATYCRMRPKAAGYCPL